MISTFIRLQMEHLDDVITQLVAFAVKLAKNHVKDGAELLVQMQDYPECCDGKTYKMEQSLVSVVLASNNIYENYETVVDKCLMRLPPHYLDAAQFGAPHSQFSEFHIRAQYVKIHQEEMDTEEKQDIMMKCDWTKLESAELKELDELGVVDPRNMLFIYHTALENTEKERDSERKQNKQRTEELESIIQESSLLNSHF